MAISMPEKKPGLFGKIAPIAGSVVGGVGGAVVGGPAGAIAGMSAGGALGSGISNLAEGDKAGAAMSGISAAKGVAGIAASAGDESSDDALVRRAAKLNRQRMGME